MHTENAMFGTPTSKYDELVERATAETLTEENWSVMLDISDSVNNDDTDGVKSALYSVRKRLNHRDPHVVIYALSLLDCLWNNAGINFRHTVSSKDFVPQLRDLAKTSITPVALKTCTIVRKWAENECSKDASLALISSLYKDLKSSGARFEDSEPKKKVNLSKQLDEEAELAKAIALSLKETKKSQISEPVQSYYPSISQDIGGPSHAPVRQQPQTREVKALYDFDAVEDNELSFKTGDIITVLEDSDPNWWKGQSHRGVGLFPSSFVANPDAPAQDQGYTNGNTPSETPIEEGPVQIDEEALLKCIQLLEECDPTGETPDPPALAYFENLAAQMAPLINQKLANIDRQHNSLASVDVAMRDVLANYDQAVQQVQYQPIPQIPNYNSLQNGQPGGFPGYPPQQQGQAFPGYPPQGPGQQSYPSNSMYGPPIPQQQQQHQFPPQQQQIPGYPPQGYAPPPQTNGLPPQGYPSQVSIAPPQTPVPQVSSHPQIQAINSLPQDSQTSSPLPPQAIAPQPQQQGFPQESPIPPQAVAPQLQQSQSQVSVASTQPTAQSSAYPQVVPQAKPQIPTSAAVPMQQQYTAPTAAAAPFVQSPPNAGSPYSQNPPSAAGSYAPSPVIPQQQQQHFVAPQPAAAPIQPSPVPITPQQHQQPVAEVRQTSPAASVAPQPQPAAQFVHPQPQEQLEPVAVPSVPVHVAPVQPSPQVTNVIAEPLVAPTPPLQPQAVVEPQQEARFVDVDDTNTESTETSQHQVTESEPNNGSAFTPVVPTAQAQIVAPIAPEPQVVQHQNIVAPEPHPVAPEQHPIQHHIAPIQAQQFVDQQDQQNFIDASQATAAQ
uniref:Signal transducing adapter molecule 1 n=1 Tax=Panagrellus redivivus TaxID=6233 RepID=A0A7E4VJF6_PANRE